MRRMLSRVSASDSRTLTTPKVRHTFTAPLPR